MNKITLNGVDYKVINPAADSVYYYVELLTAGDGKVLGYRLRQSLAYYSKRYKKWIGAEEGDRYDGATCAPDIDSFCWLFHDELCNDGTFEDGTTCNNWQASRVLSDIMRDEGRSVRPWTWLAATWLFGGGKARANGLW